MTLNDLSARAVVLIIDHLETVAPLGHTVAANTVDRTAAGLATAAKLFNIPIIISAISMGGAPKLTPALAKALGDATLHIRQTTDSFDDPAIGGAIESTGRRTVLIAGIVTEIAVQRAALGGKQRGFDTQVVFDACNGLSERSEDAALHRLNHAGVALTSLPAVVGDLAIDFSDARTQQLFGLLS